MGDDNSNSSNNENIMVDLCEYRLAPKGIKIIEDKKNWFSWHQLSENQQYLLAKFKTKMVESSLDEILEYVYKKYPTYAENSLIKEKYNGRQ